MEHSVVLAIAYASACALWWGANRVVPFWRTPERPRFARPWREVGFVLAAVIAVLLLGQLWIHGIRLEAHGALAPLAESINQILIFAPVIAVPIVRRHGWASAWLRPRGIHWRLAVGIVFACIALAVYAGLESGALSWSRTMRDVFTPTRAHLAVQVLLEDLAIAILFVRLAAALGPRWAVPAVAALFAAGHVPAMLAHGDVAAEFLGLFRDFGLGVLVIGTAWRSADIAWLWPVHFALDMTQFLTHAT